VLELADGQTLFESAAICLYLTDRYPSVGLAPYQTRPIGHCSTSGCSSR
jgi:glutathione S-transferase